VVPSGSLDNEVRLWNANTAECVGSRDFCEFPGIFNYDLSLNNDILAEDKHFPCMLTKVLYLASYFGIPSLNIAL
jgi:hypothetical protein